jgi:hypothetical protein
VIRKDGLVYYADSKISEFPEIKDVDQIDMGWDEDYSLLLTKNGNLYKLIKDDDEDDDLILIPILIGTKIKSILSQVASGENSFVLGYDNKIYVVSDKNDYLLEFPGLSGIM